jgi:putative transposase
MRRIDEHYLQHPFLGAHRMAANGVGEWRARKTQTRAAAHAANEDSGARAKAQDLETGAWAQDLCLSRRGLKIERPNEVWAADITFIPMENGFPPAVC